MMGEFMEDVLVRLDFKFIEKVKQPKAEKPAAEKQIGTDHRGKRISHKVESGKKDVHD